MMKYRTHFLYPNAVPADADINEVTAARVIGDSGAITHFAERFRQTMSELGAFIIEGIRVGSETPPLALQFRRFSNTAAFAAWTRHGARRLSQADDAYTLLLSGISTDADEEAVSYFVEWVKPQQTVVDEIRAEARPVFLNIYLNPKVVLETRIVSISTGMAAAFFDLLGAGAGDGP